MAPERPTTEKPKTNREVFLPEGSDRLSTRTLSLDGSSLTETGGAGASLCPTTGDWTAMQTVYNDDGRTSETINSDGGVTKYYYDAIGRVIKTIDPQGNINETWYDANSNVVESRRTEV